MIYKNFVFLFLSTLAALHAQRHNENEICKREVSDGDRAKGLSAIADDACMNADGCFKSVLNTNCRFCKVDAFAESEYQVCQTLLDELKVGRTCQESVSIGDRVKGLTAVYDATCESGSSDSLGCFNHCRLCQTKAYMRTPYYNCDELPTQPPTEVPTTTQATNEPTTTQATDEPTTAQATVEPTTTQAASSQPADVNLACNQKLSLEEKTSGIGAIEDATCQSGDASCFDNTCRYCKVFSTPLSDQYNACESNVCSVNVSEGDRAVGISAFVDNTCLQESKVGCWTPYGSCRYCKVFSTDISSRFVECYAQSTTSGTGSENF